MGTSVQLLGWDKASQNGSFTQNFDDQALGKQQAQRFISQGADIIMPVAGPRESGCAATARLTVTRASSAWTPTGTRQTPTTPSRRADVGQEGDPGAAVEQTVRTR